MVRSLLTSPLHLFMVIGMFLSSVPSKVGMLMIYPLFVFSVRTPSVVDETDNMQQSLFKVTFPPPFGTMSSESVSLHTFCLIYALNVAVFPSQYVTVNVS